jgi:hypothetical protein
MVAVHCDKVMKKFNASQIKNRPPQFQYHCVGFPIIRSNQNESFVEVLFKLKISFNWLQLSSACPPTGGFGVPNGTRGQN